MNKTIERAFMEQLYGVTEENYLSKDELNLFNEFMFCHEHNNFLFQKYIFSLGFKEGFKLAFDIFKDKKIKSAYRRLFSI